MTPEQFVEVKEKYTQFCIDGMDMSDMMEFVYAVIYERLETQTDVDVINEITDYAPHLINE